MFKPPKSFIDPVVSYQRGLLGRLRSALLLPTGGDGIPTTAQLTFTTFVEFVIHELRTRSLSFGSLHWLPVSVLCDPCNGLRRPDFIGHVETLAEDFKTLAEAVTELKVERTRSQA